MKKLLLLAALATAATGCKSNPYCLNCKDSGNGVIGPEDMTPGPDMVDTTVDLAGPDMLGQGPCAPTNGGKEICDGLDNDCNGVVDDVPASALQNDPNNCGACGTACKYPHAFGQCMNATCSMGACAPGYIDLNGNPADGCEYTCTPTNNGVEICDGKDNNCDGQVDESFTNSWSDAAHQMPNYDKDLNNCGQCASVCSLGPSTVMACQAGTGGKGQCVVTGCFNGLDANGVHQTYRHNPAAGNINTTGCEYHCPKPANELNVDCNPAGACTFPAEVCNGADDDCNFAVDDNLTDPGLGGPCPDGAPGKLCTSTGPNPTCGKGPCLAGTYLCVNGGLACSGSTGPSPETCDKIDNDCNGKVDDPFTATWSDGANQKPRYDSDPNNCGGCGAAFVCSLANATNICRLAAGDALGSCAVAACNPGYNYVKHTDSDPKNPKCDVTTTKLEDSTQSSTGAGCFYKCPNATTSPEVCNAIDDDCDGCINNGLTAPDICSKKGVCAGSNLTPTCDPSMGWSCDYRGIPNVSADPTTGQLKSAEDQCDDLDNNCNGPCDENFPDVQVAGGTCTNAHAAKQCTAGQGACQAQGPFVCAKKAPSDAYNDTEACSAVADNSKASDEKCNGIDDDCNGQVDERTTATINGTTYNGWIDPMVKVDVPAEPVTGGEPAHTVYVYEYEASRPGATGTSPGSLSTRACATAGVLPWSNVTLAQAEAACAAIKDSAGAPMRVCSAWEWQEACNLKASSGDHWSMSVTPTTYKAGVCNDQNLATQLCSSGADCTSGTCDASGRCTCTKDTDCKSGFTCISNVCTGSADQRCTNSTQCGKNGSCDGSGRCTCQTNSDCNAGYTCDGTTKICKGAGAWPTGVAGSSSAAQCYSDWGSGNQLHDMSGNLFEWTSTAVELKSGTAASLSAASGGLVTVTGLSNIYSSDVGAQLVISNAATAANNGTFDIVNFLSSTSVQIANAAGVAPDANNGSIGWSFIYNKVRGGAFSSVAGGTTCEFDFDIQKASFFNNDLGFRCCADNPP